jgi:hypothetical protein
VDPYSGVGLGASTSLGVSFRLAGVTHTSIYAAYEKVVEGTLAKDLRGLIRNNLCKSTLIKLDVPVWEDNPIGLKPPEEF